MTERLELAVAIDAVGRYATVRDDVLSRVVEAADSAEAMTCVLRAGVGRLHAAGAVDDDVCAQALRSVEPAVRHIFGRNVGGVWPLPVSEAGGLPLLTRMLGAAVMDALFGTKAGAEVQRRQDTLDVGFGVSALRVLELFYCAAMCVMMTAYGVPRTVIGGAARAAASVFLGTTTAEQQRVIDGADAVVGALARFRADDARRRLDECETMLKAYDAVMLVPPVLRSDPRLRHELLDSLMAGETISAQTLDVIRLLSVTDNYVVLPRG